MSVASVVRMATPADAGHIHRLIATHATEGRLLPRTLSDVTEHVDRFLVATWRGRIVGCAELAPLGAAIAEVRSLAVSRQHRGQGVGRRLVNELRERARAQRFDQLCAFVHDPDYFVRLGFSVVSHASVPEKIETDCRLCPQFGRCSQHAMLIELVPASDSDTLTARLPASARVSWRASFGEVSPERTTTGPREGGKPDATHARVRLKPDATHNGPETTDGLR
jgi:amino-acid N-acetyltransferase